MQKSKLMAEQWITVITSQFNEEITGRLKEGCLQRLRELDYSEKQIRIIDVPGAYEIPLAAKWAFQAGSQAVIALGAVVRGETTHYESVCESVERGCTQLQLDFSKPVVFGLLTTENEEQAYDRLGGSHGHKGKDAADVLNQMLIVRDQIMPLNPRSQN